MTLNEAKIQRASPEELKSRKWFEDVRSALGGAEGRKLAAEYLGHLDLDTPPDEREVPTAEILPEDERFLGVLGRDLWNGHVQVRFAQLQDRREAFQEQTGVDIISEQYAALRSVMDHPGLY